MVVEFFNNKLVPRLAGTPSPSRPLVIIIIIIIIIIIGITPLAGVNPPAIADIKSISNQT